MNQIILHFRAEGKDKSSGYIHVRFYLKREKVQFTTKVPVEAKHWNNEKMRITAGDKMAADKNLILENILARINAVTVNYKLKNRVLTKAGFEKAYNRPDDYENFYSFCDEYKKKVSKQIETVTLANHTTVLEKLKTFRPELHFDEIDLDFVVSFYSYLRKTIKNNENTAYKNMSIVRKYVKAACKAGYIDDNPFDEFHILRTKANYTYLEEEELQALINCYKKGDLSQEHYKTLQFFLFMCFGSQHVGDAKRLKLEDFNKDTFTYWRMKTRNSKPEPVTVPVSKSLRTLMTDIVGHRKKGFVFEKMAADQTMNRYLKQIADIAEVNKKITHKTGRHTFATFFLSKVPDLNTLKDIMGHSDIRQTLIYAHVLERSKTRGIKCFDVFKL